MILKNNAKLSLKKFVYKTAEAITRISKESAGWIKFDDGVQVKALSIGPIISAGTKVEVIGIDYNRLIVCPMNYDFQDIDDNTELIDILKNKHEIEKELKARYHLKQGDRFIEDDPETAIDEYYKAEYFSSDKKRLIKKLKRLADEAKLEGDLELAIKYYNKILDLIKSSF